MVQRKVMSRSGVRLISLKSENKINELEEKAEELRRRLKERAPREKL
jgi:hypothetical protein